MNIKLLSDKKLIELFTKSVKEERKATLLVLELVAEIYSRKLYLKYGYTSLFVYLTTELNYSEGATHRRIASAKVISKYPEVKGMLLDGRLSLTNLARLSKDINDKNKEELLALASNKSSRELENLLLDLKPPVDKKPVEKIKPVTVKKESTKPAPLFDSKVEQRCENHFRRRSSNQIEVEKRLNLRFSVAEDTQKLIDEAKELLSSKLPKGASLEELFVAGLNALVAEKKRKLKVLGSRASRKSKINSRHIPNKIRKAVLERDGNRCTFKDKGKICGCSWNLELDHIVPFAEGGEHTVDNLRVLCGAHNRYLAEQRFGRVWEAA
ncbi:MAG: HNH endonuclease [Bdellovibrionota bacterium]